MNSLHGDKYMNINIPFSGYKFTPSVINQLTHRYSNEQHSIDLESFLICMIRILNLHGHH